MAFTSQTSFQMHPILLLGMLTSLFLVEYADEINDQSFESTNINCPFYRLYIHINYLLEPVHMG